MSRRKEGSGTELIVVNEVDLEKVPETVRNEICRSALEGVMRCRKDPDWQARFRKWKEERSRAS